MSQTSNEYLSRRTGFALVCALVVFVFVWLATRGVASMRAAPLDLPTPIAAADIDRFRGDSFYLPNESLLGFVEIPAGPFIMGSNPDIDRQAFINERWSRESYQGEVDLPVFYIQRYEVTVAQFREFVIATGTKVKLDSLGAGLTHPVTNVTFPEALAYARWLDTTLRQSANTPDQLRTLLNSGWRVALPDEAQWEKAARGSNGRIYPWGNAFSKENAAIGGVGIQSVGAVRCNDCAFGLADMSGNIWEMTVSPLRPYPFSKFPADVNAPALFVMRGGAFNSEPNTARAAVRGGVDPGARSDLIGFRVVLSKVD